MSFSNDTKNDLKKNKIEHFDCDYKKNGLNLEKDCCKKEYLKEVFLQTGSITDPNLEYHLEMSFKSVEILEKIIKILDSFEIEARVTTRKGFYIVYIKESDEISNFLSLIGAYKSLLEIQNIKVLKEMRNNINRVVNCETANLSKTINTSVRQVEKINYLKINNYFKILPKQLEEIADLRLKYPDATLEELGKFVTPKLTKSGVNHRLKKLEEIANKYQKSNDKG